LFGKTGSFCPKNKKKNFLKYTDNKNPKPWSEDGPSGQRCYPTPDWSCRRSGSAGPLHTKENNFFQNSFVN
jgi:hypothetical protein